MAGALAEKSTAKTSAREGEQEQINNTGKANGARRRHVNFL